MAEHSSRTWVLFTFFALGTAVGAAAQEERHEDHEELRAMLRTVKDALVAKEVDRLAPILDVGFTIITVDQQRFKGLAEFKAYWNGLFREDKALLKSVAVNPQADELTRFLGEDTGISTGTSEDRYEFADGETRVMKVRWSAVVHKVGGHWKLVSLHIGTNLLDNPVLDAAKRMLAKVGGGALLAGIVLGAIGGYATGRRSPRRA